MYYIISAERLEDGYTQVMIQMSPLKGGRPELKGIVTYTQHTEIDNFEVAQRFVSETFALEDTIDPDFLEFWFAEEGATVVDFYEIVLEPEDGNED